MRELSAKDIPQYWTLTESGTETNVTENIVAGVSTRE